MGSLNVSDEILAEVSRLSSLYKKNNKEIVEELLKRNLAVLSAEYRTQEVVRFCCLFQHLEEEQRGNLKGLLNHLLLFQQHITPEKIMRMRVILCEKSK